MKTVNQTGLSFVLWSGGVPHYIGFDGRHKSLFFEGGAWGGFHDAGQSPLKANVQYELQLQRQSGEIKARTKEFSMLRRWRQ